MTRYATILLASALTVLLAGSAAFAGGATAIYDFVDHYPDARITNALSSAAKTATSGGIEKRAIFLHPMGQGDAVAEYAVSLPKLGAGERLVLCYSKGLDDGVKNDDTARPSDGVTFELKINGKRQFADDLKDPGWVSRTMDLTPQAGKKIRVALITRANKNTNYDWALWGSPQILRLPKDALSIGTNDLAKGLVVAKPSKDATLTVTPLNGSGQPIIMSLAKGTFTAMRFDFAASGTQSVKIDYSGDAEEVDVYAFAPSIEIAAFGPTSAIVYQGRETTLRAVVRNIGEGELKASDEGSLRFDQFPAIDRNKLTVGPMGPSSIATIPIGAIEPGESKTVECKFTPAGNAAEVMIGASVSTKGNPGIGLTKAVAVVLNPMDPGKAAAAVEAKQLSDGSVVVQNEKLRVQFAKSSTGFAAWTISIPRGDRWEQVAAGPFGRLVTGNSADQSDEHGLYPTEAKTSANSVTFSTKQQIDKATCTFEWTFTLSAHLPRISVAQSVTADRPVNILHFSGPTIYAGEGSFGGKKDEGLFPGLEYLLTEQSSGTEFVYPPKSLRTVPHPNKITIPFMAVRNAGTLVMLEWDPLQEWTAGADRPAAVFASSNFIDAQDNHLMGIFAPSVPDHTPENALVAEKPFKLAAGKSVRLAASIEVKSDSSTVLDAVDSWVARHGLPDVPSVQAKKASEIMDLCDRAFLQSSWDPAAKAWKHTNTGPVYFDPMIANYLLTRDNRVYSQETSRKIQAVVRPAVEKAAKNLPVGTALLVGGVKEALDRQYAQIEALIASQREDGSWAFTPDKEHEVFGKPGDTSSGWTALRAQQILEHALMTGDPKAREAGLKALKYLDTTVRPEGAQTWELQLHVPDILASAYLVRSYLAGYRLTDDKQYLDRAVYWAKSGLPFVYLWNAEDRPIMRYGTIPVFGSTWFDRQPWFGVMVQWCGLEYGYSLEKLSDFDKTMQWKQIAKGILYCGVQQQEYITREYPEDAGMYPDAYSPVKGKEEYHWDLNPRLIARNLLRDVGADSEPTTYHVRDRRSQLLTLTLPVQGASIEYRPDWLTLDFKYSAGPTIYGILSKVFQPESVGLNDEAVLLSTDLSTRQSGWEYDRERTISILKLRPIPTNRMVFDLLQHEMQPLPDAGAAKQPEGGEDDEQQPK